MSEQPKVVAHIENVVILERISKNGNKYKAMYGQDENGKLYFIAFVK